MARKHRNRQTSWGPGGPDREPPEICPTAGKRMYASEAEAAATARHQMAEKQSASLQLRTYRCLYCDSWHLTSKDA